MKPLCLALTLFLALPAVAPAQPTAPWTLTVTDQTGAVIPHAEIRIETVTGKPYITRSDSNGNAPFNNPTVAFALSVAHPSFEPLRKVLDPDTDRPAVERAKLHVRRNGLLSEGPVVEPKLAAVNLAAVISEHGLFSEPEMINDPLISPSRPIPTGKAPGMTYKLVSGTAGEKVYAVIFVKGDEVLSGLTDFALQNHIESAHLTAIGAVSAATLGWLDLSQKMYHAIPIRQQVEVLSMIGDIATFNGKPIVHAHLVCGKQDGSTIGGHLWEAYVNPTLEVFVSVDPTPLKKRPDEPSGMKIIDPKQEGAVL